MNNQKWQPTNYQKDRLISTNFWIGHMSNIKTVFRNDIKKVTKDILKLNLI